jgi:uncharacterized protein with FMN-binding domain
MKKTFVLLIVAALVIIAIGIAVFMATAYPMLKEQAEVRKMPIHDVGLAKVKNGTYRGDFTYGNFTYQVQVVVEKHEMKQISILKNRSESEHAKKAEDVVDKVLKAQSVKVDVVTGATTTSKALLKAIENALASGLE